MNISERSPRRPQGLIAHIAPLALLLAGTAACTDEPETVAEPETPVAEVEQIGADEDWIRLDGSVVSTTPSTFVLDFGEDTILVEADDWDIGSEGLGIIAGDRVAVTGRVDNNLFASDSIEASAIFLQNLNTVYYANSADEEEFGLAAVPTDPMADGVDYTGWVTGTSENGFTLGAGVANISVDTAGLNTPLVSEGVETGDRVYVWGDLDLFDEGESTLVAEGLVELIDAGDTGSDGISSDGQGGAESTG